jgi:hypothetical protein
VGGKMRGVGTLALRAKEENEKQENHVKSVV